jgi:hypothetical protein
MSIGLFISGSTRRVRCSALMALGFILKSNILEDLSLPRKFLSPSGMGVGGCDANPHPNSVGLNPNLNPSGVGVSPNANPSDVEANPNASTTGIGSNPNPNSGGDTNNVIAANSPGYPDNTDPDIRIRKSGSGKNSPINPSAPTVSASSPKASYSFVRISNCPVLTEFESFREKLVLYFILIIGACWSPDLITGKEN